MLFLFFCIFYLAFLSRKFTIHRTAGEGGGYLLLSFLPLPPTLQRLRHCYKELTSVGIEHGTFGAGSLEFTLSTLALVAAIVRMLKTRVTLGNISHAFLNLTKILIFAIFKFGQLIEYNLRNIFLEKSYRKCGGETIAGLFFKKIKIEHISGPIFENYIHFDFIVCQVEDYRID